jgi:hypothetical protein
MKQVDYGLSEMGDRMNQLILPILSIFSFFELLSSHTDLEGIYGVKTTSALVSLDVWITQSPFSPEVMVDL